MPFQAFESYPVGLGCGIGTLAFTIGVSLRLGFRLRGERLLGPLSYDGFKVFWLEGLGVRLRKEQACCEEVGHVLQLFRTLVDVQQHEGPLSQK